VIIVNEDLPKALKEAEKVVAGFLSGKIENDKI
jgi:hypothetical protein